MREEFLDTELPQSIDGSRPLAPVDAWAEAAPGARVGRYVVLSTIGAGTMGVVLAAYDPKLDRKVALKLIKAPPGTAEPFGARLQREAQALAKLDHPNVVAVHDIVEHAGRLFVGMEYVDGRTLRAWLDGHEGPPPWPETLRVFCAAGRGLAAAHEAGLIHRDFKPDNVMIGDDGRVRVMDFGLVRSESGDDEAAPRTEARGPLRDSIGLTQTGAMMGTPAYMSIEQFSGEADARSDQFSFCVALYEALYGERPFSSATLGGLLQKLEDGRIREPPADAKVPSWLRKVVVRGLAADRQERWPSMEALLDALQDDPAPRRARRRGIALTVLLGVGAAVVAWSALDRDAEACSRMDAPLAGVWDDGRRREVEAAIGATQLSYAPGTWERVEAKLDTYAEGWVAARVAACEASYRGEESGELLERRMACLDDRLPHLKATVALLGRADEEVVTSAVQIVEGLPGLGACADVEALRDRLPLPEDPEQARRVEELEARLAEIDTLALAGKYELARGELEIIVGEAEALGYEPLLVWMGQRQGSLEAKLADYEAAEATLARAYRAALGLRMMNEAAKAAASLVYVVGYALARHEEGRRWALDADALARAADSDEARGSRLHNLGTVDLREGKHEDALAHFSEAHALRVEVLGSEHPETLGSLVNMGIAAAEAGRHAEAREHLERALDSRTRVLGPEHPDVARSVQNLSTIALMMGDHDGASELLQRALTLKERALGPEHLEVASTLHNLGDLAREQGRPQEAREYLERALALEERALGPEHPRLRNALDSLGLLARGEGDLEQARERFERSVAIVEAALGSQSPQLAAPLEGLASVAREQGELALRAGEPTAAIPHLERALEIHGREGTDPRVLGATRFALARALWVGSGTPRDRLRARELATLAREDYAGADEAGEARVLEEIDAWLATHE